MLDSPRSIPDGATLEFALCIVGAGAAGITLAREFANSDLKVCLLEAGGLEPSGISDDHPYAGESIGIPYSLLATRLRYFGGTTNHWGGWCRPLEEIDFRRRSFICHSGWPIRRSDLDRYYLKAQQVCEIEPPGFALDQLPVSGLTSEGFFHDFDQDFVTKTFRFSPPTRFGLRYRSQLQNSRSVTCLLDSTTVEIRMSQRRISAVHVQAQGKSFRVRAGAYILALGAIENARLLLHSNGQLKRGIGNDHDLVGRFFADHIGKEVGLIWTWSKAPYIHFRKGEAEVFPHLSFRDDFLTKNGLVNFGIVFSGIQAESLLSRDYLWDKKLFDGPGAGARKGLFRAIARLETVPNPDSRVRLSNERDANGMRRVRLDWRLDGLEFKCLGKIAEVLGQKVGAAGLGRFKQTYFDSPEIRQGNFTIQAHHLGTTRMSESPEEGVVDPTCRVHSVDNLFVAGSSVFPTFGFANPTLTIVALALRLADHLKSLPWIR